LGEASYAIEALEHIDASSASGFFSSACPQETRASLFSFHPAWGANVRHLLLEALREVRAVYDRGLPGRLHGAAKSGHTAPWASTAGTQGNDGTLKPWRAAAGALKQGLLGLQTQQDSPHILSVPIGDHHVLAHGMDIA
jgi:hypothetical protein